MPVLRLRTESHGVQLETIGAMFLQELLVKESQNCAFLIGFTVWQEDHPHIFRHCALTQEFVKSLKNWLKFGPWPYRKRKGFTKQEILISVTKNNKRTEALAKRLTLWVHFGTNLLHHGCRCLLQQSLEDNLRLAVEDDLGWHSSFNPNHPPPTNT